MKMEMFGVACHSIKERGKIEFIPIPGKMRASAGMGIVIPGRKENSAE